MKFGSLFSGIGGFDLSFEQAGISCSWQVEIDKDCQRVLQRHWPEVKRYEDVSTIGKLESVDVICGGFPCQDLSVAGKRAGLAGKRSGLWFEFLRIIGLNRPRWIVIENVPGLLSSDEHRDFAAILRGLVECGYCLAWRVLDAQFYGVAQRRRRVFIVGSLGDGSSAEILFESESVSWNPPTRREAGPGVARAISGGAHPGGHNGQDDDQVIVAACLDGSPYADREAEESRLITHALRSEGADASEDGTGRGTPLVAAPITSAFAKHHGRTAGNNGGADNLIVEDLEHHRFHCLTCGLWFGVNDYEQNTVTCPRCGETHIDKITDVLDARAVDVRSLRMQPGATSGTLQAKKSGGYSLNYQNPIMAFRACGQDGFTPSEEVTPPIAATDGGGGNAPTIAFTERTRSEGRTFEAQEELAYAITNPGSGGRTHSRQVAGQFGVRRLTPTECERLQSFPDGWTATDAEGKQISDSARYRMLGNAVTVSVARFLATRLRMSFDLNT